MFDGLRLKGRREKLERLLAANVFQSAGWEPWLASARSVRESHERCWIRAGSRTARTSSAPLRTSSWRARRTAATAHSQRDAAERTVTRRDSTCFKGSTLRLGIGAIKHDSDIALLAARERSNMNACGSSTH